MNLLLDAGALIALERGDVLTHRVVKHQLTARKAPRTHAAVLGQVWTGGARQPRLTKVLPTIQVVPLDQELGERAGVLLGRARTSDVVDAALVVLAVDGDMILTSDPDDLAVLAHAAGVHIDLVTV